MTLQERIDRYLDRNLRQEQAETLVLMEEAAIALFSGLPDYFVLFGGATLVLFHGSPRISKDLDLLSRVERLPTAQEIGEALETRVQEVAGALGLGPVTFEPETEGEHFLRLWVVGPEKQRLFTVDLTRMGGSVLSREIVKEKIEQEGKTSLIPAASRDYLLLQKAESFVSRKVVKARDAFDIRLLLLRGAKLDSLLKAHLQDALMWREVNREQIEERIEKVDQKLCRAELKPVLPEEVYEEQEKDDFEVLRAAVRSVFSEWL
ncbi:MAG TPA: nucleotidyl transferase AbiEii/AbiGii toxin family protein [Candidatus Acidoferrum sp.]|nr:nucleotidyl transferase AbiEii/AbiGii toxin family protein [Candidatus Acidoferrum sp.]